MALEGFVSITGIVQKFTALGIFLNVDERPVFIPGQYILHAFRRFELRETVTLKVLRRFASLERLAG